MSLINDALKRAKDAQQKSQPSAPGPQLRPLAPTPIPKQGVGMMLSLIVVLIVLLAVLLVSQSRQKAAAKEPVADTKPVAPVASAPETKPPVQAVAAATPTAPEKPTAAPAAPVSAASTPAPELKLQAIFFSPGHSSAIISGKTVRAGDVLRGFRVAAITQTSATLFNATQTNVMTLEQ